MNEFYVKTRTTSYHIICITVLVLLTRVLYILSPAGQIGDADEAVFGMMAQKIQKFEEFPIYCWEAQYAGALVSYLAVPVFNLFGSGFVQLRSAMFPFALFSPILFYFVCRRIIGNKLSLYCSLFIVFSPFFVLHHTMAAYGGYGEMCFGLGSITLLSWKIEDNNEKYTSIGWIFALGGLCGFFFYTFFLILPVILAFALPAVFKRRDLKRAAIFFAIGFLCGAAPLIIHNIFENGGTLFRAAGRSFDIGREALNLPLSELIYQILMQKISYFIAWIKSADYLLGCFLLPEIFPKWLIRLGGWILALLLILFLYFSFSQKKLSDKKNVYFRQFAFFLIYLILFQWMANLNRSRHLLPLLYIIPISLFALTRGKPSRQIFIITILCVISVIQVIGWVVKTQGSNFDPKPVASAMQRLNIREFYGSYWIVYPIIFSSNSEIFGSPSLVSGNDIFSDRRPYYTQQVNEASSPAFVFKIEEERLEKKFQKFIHNNEIVASTYEIGGTKIYYQLSRPVHAFVKSNSVTYFLTK